MIDVILANVFLFVTTSFAHKVKNNCNDSNYNENAKPHTCFKNSPYGRTA